jgi:hypothetical protein
MLSPMMKEKPAVYRMLKQQVRKQLRQGVLAGATTAEVAFLSA